MANTIWDSCYHTIIAAMPNTAVTIGREFPPHPFLPPRDSMLSNIPSFNTHNITFFKHGFLKSLVPGKTKISFVTIYLVETCRWTDSMRYYNSRELEFEKHFTLWTNTNTWKHSRTQLKIFAARFRMCGHMDKNGRPCLFVLLHLEQSQMVQGTKNKSAPTDPSGEYVLAFLANASSIRIHPGGDMFSSCRGCLTS